MSFNIYDSFGVKIAEGLSDWKLEEYQKQGLLMPNDKVVEIKNLDTFKRSIPWKQNANRKHNFYDKSGIVINSVPVKKDKKNVNYAPSAGIFHGGNIKSVSSGHLKDL